MLHPLQERLFFPLPLFIARVDQNGAGGKPSLKSFNDPDPLNVPQLNVDNTSIQEGLFQEWFRLLHIPTMDNSITLNVESGSNGLRGFRVLGQHQDGFRGEAAPIRFLPVLRFFDI